MNRREFIKLSSAAWVMLQSSVLGAKNPAQQKKIVWIVLRGAADSLHAIVPVKDRHIMSHRKALLEPIADDLLKLNDEFSLHPKFKNLHRWYQDKQMLPVVAVATAYRERSHFDAQDMLESGYAKINHHSGWLARAISQYHGDAIAIAHSMPLSLRGGENARSWYPSNLPEVDQDLHQQVLKLYANDKDLHDRFSKGLETRSMLGKMDKSKRNPKFIELIKNCGKLLAQSSKATCAMLEMGGWDTHDAQVRRLNNQFETLDNGLAQLKIELGKEWANTVVVVATEFGRTIAVNGTNGTDHGTASALFLTGGAINGGRVLGRWPGLAPEQLFEGRDLKPTSDTRQWLATILQQHWQLSTSQLQEVFPGIQPSNEKLIV